MHLHLINLKLQQVTVGVKGLPILIFKIYLTLVSYSVMLIDIEVVLKMQSTLD